MPPLTDTLLLVDPAPAGPAPATLSLTPKLDVLLSPERAGFGSDTGRSPLEQSSMIHHPGSRHPQFSDLLTDFFTEGGDRKDDRKERSPHFNLHGDPRHHPHQNQHQHPRSHNQVYNQHQHTHHHRQSPLFSTLFGSPFSGPPTLSLRTSGPVLAGGAVLGGGDPMLRGGPVLSVLPRGDPMLSGGPVLSVVPRGDPMLSGGPVLSVMPRASERTSGGSSGASHSFQSMSETSTKIDAESGKPVLVETTNEIEDQGEPGERSKRTTVTRDAETGKILGKETVMVNGGGVMNNVNSNVNNGGLNYRQSGANDVVLTLHDLLFADHPRKRNKKHLGRRKPAGITVLELNSNPGTSSPSESNSVHTKPVPKPVSASTGNESDNSNPVMSLLGGIGHVFGHALDNDVFGGDWRPFSSFNSNERIPNRDIRKDGDKLSELGQKFLGGGGKDGSGKGRSGKDGKTDGKGGENTGENGEKGSNVGEGATIRVQEVQKQVVKKDGKSDDNSAGAVDWTNIFSRNGKSKGYKKNSKSGKTGKNKFPNDFHIRMPLTAHHAASSDSSGTATDNATGKTDNHTAAKLTSPEPSFHQDTQFFSTVIYLNQAGTATPYRVLVDTNKGGIWVNDADCNLCGTGKK
jgi:hypothetical protein